jgi:hypothetical protein
MDFTMFVYFHRMILTVSIFILAIKCFSHKLYGLVVIHYNKTGLTFGILPIFK